jgi:hypothetical protein
MGMRKEKKGTRDSTGTVSEGSHVNCSI